MVQADEPWILWRTADFVTWERIAVRGAGRHVYVDKGVMDEMPYAFYRATPARHYGQTK